VNNSKLITSYLAPFPRYGGLLIQFSLSTSKRHTGGTLPLWRTISGWTDNFRIAKFGPKKRDIPLSYGVKCISISWTV